MRQSMFWILSPAALLLAMACSLLTGSGGASPAAPAAEPTKKPEANAPPTENPAAAFDSWPVYTNADYQFQLRYPPGGKLQDHYDVYARIDLPFADGTELREKYLEANVWTGYETCGSMAPGIDDDKTDTVRINAIDWLREAGGDAGAGSAHGVTAYSTEKGDVCINLDFVMVTTHADNFDPTLLPYDPEAERAVFRDIVSTFRWLD